MTKQFKSLSLIIAIFFCHNFASAQYYTDAINYSQTSIYGSSRFLGTGGANSSLGGDEGNISNNPAGLGFNTKPLFSISPGINVASASSTFLSNTVKDYRLNANLGNLSMVFSDAKDNPGIYKGSTIGISYTRTNNFQNQFHYSGSNPYNSMSDYFAEISNGYVDSTGFDNSDYFNYGNLYNIRSLAYFGYLIDPTSHSSYVSKIEFAPNYNGFPVKQDEVVLVTGKQSQWNFSYGGNFNDRFYIGASLGIPMINNSVKRTYTETPTNPNPINGFTFIDNQRTSGTGVNFKIGLIVKASEVFRIGVSAQTPTYYWMSNDFNYILESRFNPGALDDNNKQLQNSSLATVPGSFSYHLITPGRIKGGISIFAGKHGFISGDVEYVDYASASLSNSNNFPNDFSYDNNRISTTLKSTINIYLGGELRLNIFRIRAGFAYIDSPYKSGNVLAAKYNQTLYNITFGAGIRKNDYFIDAALVNSLYNKTFGPYTLQSGQEPIAFIKNKNSNLTVTLGKFF